MRHIKNTLRVSGSPKRLFSFSGASSLREANCHGANGIIHSSIISKDIDNDRQFMSRIVGESSRVWNCLACSFLWHAVNFATKGNRSRARV